MTDPRADELAREVPDDAARIAAGLSKAQRWVPEYEGRYCVDDRGEVFSIARTFERDNRGRQQVVRVPSRRLTQCLNRNGYPFVRLYAGNKGRTFEVHRIVCRAFHGEPTEDAEAAHLDGDKTHTAPANLAWKSRADNMADKRRHGTHLTGEAVPGAKLTVEKAIAIYQRAQAGEVIRVLAREFGVDEAAIRKIKRGTLWSDATVAVRQILTQDASHE
jgi:hypothetical protein